jgi:hypothetical protein
MMYNLNSISKMSLNVEKYEIFQQFGHGVMESHYRDGEVIRTLECSEFDAYIISENMNIEMWGNYIKKKWLGRT